MYYYHTGWSKTKNLWGRNQIFLHYLQQEENKENGMKSLKKAYINYTKKKKNPVL